MCLCVSGDVMLTGNHEPLVCSEQNSTVDQHQLVNNQPLLMKLASTQQCMMSTGQELMSSHEHMTDGQIQHKQLPDIQQQQHHFPEFSVSSDELLRSQQDLTLDALMLSRSYMEDLCPVCNDRVSGYHYGLQTCESCKGNITKLTNFCGHNVIFCGRATVD